MATGRHSLSVQVRAPPSPPTPPQKEKRFSHRSTRRSAQAACESQRAELEIEEQRDEHERERRQDMLAAMFGDGRVRPRKAAMSRSSRSSSDASASASASMAHSLGQREKPFRHVRHGSDPLQNDDFYATQMQVGNFVKMGWLTKQGHLWKSWKTRFFVLFSDGTFAYYKNKGRKKIKGCMQLNDGVVSVQHVDIRVAEKAYVFQIEKGFYRLLCYCCSQFEAELWVSALRSVRRAPPLCLEMDLTATEEKAGSNAVTRHLNKIFITDKQTGQWLATFKDNEQDHSFEAIHNFIVELDDAIIDRHHLEFYQDAEVELLPGNELVRLIRRYVEDRVFIPLYAEAYASLETSRLKLARNKAVQNLKVLQLKTQADFGIPDYLSAVCDWKQVIAVVNMLDCVSLPTHKLEVILAASKAITSVIARYNGEMFDVSDDTLTAIFRYVVTMSSLRDLPILRAFLKYGYLHHPACQNKANVVTSFLNAIKWVESYETNDESYQFDSMTLAASRVSVSISTNDVGIQFTTDGNGRGAIVYGIRKLSQAALSASIVPGLSLIAINHEPVVSMSFEKIIQRVRTASLPKRLTFMTEFYYYQLLSLDTEIFQYLTCLAAQRGDLDTAMWLRGYHVDVNSLCSWEKSRGRQIFGFSPKSGKGSPLHGAVRNGHWAMVHHLLSAGADANLRDYKGRRPLHVMLQSADMALIIEQLIEAGAEIDSIENEGRTPLMLMCSRGSLEGATTLFKRGADVRRVAWSNGFSALEFAVQAGHTKLVTLCLSKGGNPNAQTLEGDTSLHLAAALPHPGIILQLLQASANPNVQNRYGQTPAAVLLALAPGGGGDDRILCLEILSSAGCRLEKRDLFGRQASHLASISSDSKMWRLLRKMGSIREVNDDAEVDIFGCSARDYSQLTEANVAVGYLGAQRPNELWKAAVHIAHASSTTWFYSIEDMVYGLASGTNVDLADVVAFVLFLDSFTSLNEVVDRLSEHVGNGPKGHGLIRLFVIILLFKREAPEVNDLRERFYAFIEQGMAVPREKLMSMIEEYTSLYREYFSLRGAGDYLKNYKVLPAAMIKLYGATSAPPSSQSRAAFSRKLHRYINAERWAEQCTLLTHTIFCSIPVQDFISTSSKKTHSDAFVCAKRWFQHLLAYVINDVLVQDTPKERAEVITFFLKAAEHCASLHNHDTMAAILYALQSTAVQRLRKSIDCLSVASTKLMNQMQVLSDKGCREMNRLMRKTANPSMPYIGLYLQSFVGLNELPVFDKTGLVNGNRLRRMGELAMEILHRQSVAYTLQYDASIDKLLHVSLPYDTDEARYSRSLELEPREADAMPLSDRGSRVVDDLDIENEVRESIGAEGTFGFRQWFRMQKVVHRHRSRSTVTPEYEWV